MPSSSHSITIWIDRLRQSDPLAAQELWQRFFTGMVEVARRRLGGLPRGPADEEDVALEAFARFHRGMEAGRFPNLQDRGDLWRILFALTVNSAATLLRNQGRQKRGGGVAMVADAVPIDDGPSPEEVACLRESLARL